MIYPQARSAVRLSNTRHPDWAIRTRRPFAGRVVMWTAPIWQGGAISSRASLVFTAPTAAAQAEYCVNNRLTVAKSDLQPGDLVSGLLTPTGGS